MFSRDFQSLLQAVHNFIPHCAQSRGLVHCFRVSSAALFVISFFFSPASIEPYCNKKDDSVMKSSRGKRFSIATEVVHYAPHSKQRLGPLLLLCAESSAHCSWAINVASCMICSSIFQHWYCTWWWLNFSAHCSTRWQSALQLRNYRFHWVAWGDFARLLVGLEGWSRCNHQLSRCKSA